MKRKLWILALVALTNPVLSVHSADAGRQAAVAARGAEVMPFELKETTHIFTKSDSGGTQRIIAKETATAQQAQLVREHLREIQAQFQRGDYSGPAHIHGQHMPGLAKLQSAQPGKIEIAYADVKGGGELTFRTRDGKLLTALHQWMDAQLADHGVDAMQGHQKHTGSMHGN